MKRDVLLRLGLPAVHALALSTLLPGGAAAQSLRGRVVDESTGRPVSGALVTLMAADGSTISRGLADNFGSFVLKGVGRQLRIELIGYSSESRDLPSELGDSVLTFNIRPAPISLPEIEGSTKRCEKTGELNPETYAIWQEARKALTITAWTAQSAVIKFQIEQRKIGQRTPRRDNVDITQSSSTVSGTPFSAAQNAEDFSKKGFIQSRDGTYVYYAPDAETILSEEFQRTHCFRVVRDGRKPELLGLGFEPSDGAPIYDVKGILWLDRRTLSLTHLDYSYRKLPTVGRLDQAIGRLTFLRLPNGTWIVSEWFVQIPMVQFNGWDDDPVELAQRVLTASVNEEVVYKDSRRTSEWATPRWLLRSR